MAKYHYVEFNSLNVL